MMAEKVSMNPRHGCRDWYALALACVAGSMLGCAGSVQQPEAADNPLALPFVRSAAADSDEFRIQQAGADFATDLPHNRVVTAGTQARVTPDWKPGMPHALDAAAYALYRLKLDPAVPAALTLEWGDDAPQACWIGLADWNRQVWQWWLLPPDGVLALDSPEPYSTAEQQCVTAVVALGSTEHNLLRIGFGEDEPPPTGDGYTLFTPWQDTHSYLIDMEGNVVHSWDSPSISGMGVDLLPNGHLLRQRMLENPAFMGSGPGGCIEEYTWDGTLVWTHQVSDDRELTHHDFEPLPNGNILLTVWNKVTKDEMIASGRNPLTIFGAAMLIDSIREIQPLPKSGAETVWEWKATEHLVQDIAPTKANYGDPAQHPELIDVNFASDVYYDWLHVNGVAYNAGLDQIVISVHSFNEIWIIDHSTTAEEVQGHSGGNGGRGGDLLYRWGNPQAYRQGGAAERMLYGQHDPQWIPAGFPGAGHLTLFNNLAGSKYSQQFSSVIEIDPPLNPDGSYSLTDGAYGPAEPLWAYTADPPGSMFSMIISSAQRLPNGDTLICVGDEGRFLQLNAANEQVWTYTNTMPAGGSFSVFRAKRYPADYPGLAALQQAGD